MQEPSEEVGAEELTEGLQIGNYSFNQQHTAGQIIEALKDSLNSGFAEEKIPVDLVDDFVPDPKDDDHHAMDDAKKNWDNYRNEHYDHEANEYDSEFDSEEEERLFDTLIEAVSTCIENCEGPFEQAFFQTMYADICNESDRIEYIQATGKNNAILAGNTYQELGRFDGELVALGSLFTAITTSVKHFQKEKWKSDQGSEVQLQLDQSIIKLTDRFPTLIANADSAYLRKTYTVPVESEAIRVEQGEVGYANEGLIGTDNLQDCICLMLHNPETKMTAVAHIDSSIDPASLNQIMQNMGTPPIQARLLGGREASEIARSNMEKVANFLKHENVEVLSACLFEDELQEAVAVDTQTFKLREAIPWKHDINSNLAQGVNILLTPESSRPIHEAFNHAVTSEKRNPVLLNPVDPNSDLGLHELSSQSSYMHIYDWCKNRLESVSEEKMPVVVGRMFFLNQHRQIELNRLNTAIEHRIETMLNNPQLIQAEVDISDNAKYVATMEAKLALANHPLYIGVGAHEANQELMDFITAPRQFISIQPNPDGGHVIHLNKDGLPLPMEMRKPLLPDQNKKRKRTPTSPEKSGAAQASGSATQGTSQIHVVDSSGWATQEHSELTIKGKVMAAFGVDPGSQFKFILEGAPVAIDEAKQLLHNKKVIAVMGNGDAVVAKNTKYNKKALPLELVVLTKETIDSLKKEYEQLKVEEGKDSRLIAKRSKGLGNGKT